MFFSKTVQELMEMSITEEGSQFISVEGVNTHYIIKGRGEKILLIHGVPSHTYTWKGIIDNLSQDFEVIAFDLIGHGLTDSPNISYSLDALVEFTKRFMDALDIQKVTLMGHSTGGEVAWRLVLKYPEKVERLVLISASGYPRKSIPLIEKLLRIPLVGKIISGMSSKWIIRMNLKEVFYNDELVTDELVDMYYYRIIKKGNRQALLKLAREGPDDLYKSIKDIKIPTLIIWGKNDLWHPLEHGKCFANDIQGSQLIVLPECGHVPQEEKTKEVVTMVRKFYAKQFFSSKQVK